MTKKEAEVNIDFDVVEHFGKEWHSFDQSGLSESDNISEFNKFKSIDSSLNIFFKFICLKFIFSKK